MSLKDQSEDSIKNSLSEKYESEMVEILEELKKDENVGKAIDRIIEEAADLGEMQSKLILLIKKHLAKRELKTDKLTGKKIKFNDEEVEQDISKFTRNLIKRYEGADRDIDANNSIYDKYPLDAKAKASVKKIIKEFAIYEVYKVMNPRRIAGETKKDNYAHNMMMGGQKRASKYEGGKESDLKSYGEAEVRRIEQASKTFQKGGGGLSI
ncbi:MAG: hypothetical protein FJX70_01645 [Alphaproteobacteria bacterium]|jgi:hypothetical protein|nr:hypothetical protein [Alphaproteobacteria bacterium]